jgi:hypothetical protein
LQTTGRQRREGLDSTTQVCIAQPIEGSAVVCNGPVFCKVPRR